MNDLKTPSEFRAFREAKCPRCRKGNVFIGATYQLKSQKMHNRCPHCALKFEREPGYFYVSMFVSYAMSVAEMVTTCLATYVLTGIDNDFWLYLGIALGTVIVLAPFNFRYSRLILLYWLSPGLNFVPDWYNRPPVGNEIEKKEA
jgi:uncharacterized protein (DUF983 family)